jgi:hypothetical protein
VWVGVTNRVAAPQLWWELDGQPAAPRAVRPISSVRGPQQVNANTPRVFTGVYEFPGMQPGTVHRLTVVADGEACGPISVRTLPAALPAGADEWFNILLVSCYHYVEAPRGVLEAVIAEVAREQRPHLSVLLGDQVYLDLPTLSDLPDDEGALAEKFEKDYVHNWFGPEGYSAVLAAAPSVCTPDDHEYWNNFPHASPFIGNTFTEEGRGRWRRAARAAYDAFQAPHPASAGDPVIIDVPPVSVFVADTRTFRDPGKQHALRPGVIAELASWVDRLNANGGFGLFACGQSLFDAAAGSVGGAVGDRTLANYDDFGPLVNTLVLLRKPLLCLTGDVHWGRVVQVSDVQRENQVAIYEVITSPSSLVTTVGKDPINKAKGWLDRLLGKPNPWPRHGEPGEPSPFFADTFVGSKQFVCTGKHRQSGDQVAVVSLRRQGAGIQARIAYYPVHPDPTVRARQKMVRVFDLSAGIA